VWNMYLQYCVEYVSSLLCGICIFNTVRKTSSILCGLSSILCGVCIFNTLEGGTYEGEQLYKMYWCSVLAGECKDMKYCEQGSTHAKYGDNQAAGEDLQ
jgi:hypothetical protein